ncbi:phosphatase PAP2 family protein [Duganella phyllosphaerae]|uniref:Undecaprenyl-diphosphatase BcrC n=1 Tax=Duganella phyllosphaerae TaxID=762836 RepID=A0A1E7X4A4_9BURK|nr:phosphatase PAP2 family protein [Duganella phyllosphaerae]OFA07265.1 undecaprenyl-diphosphatase BcrC [Duganella phyllosphaerae]
MGARLTPGGQFGLHLTLGVLIMIVSVGIFGQITDEVTDQDAITVLDLQIAHWFNANHVEPYTSFMLFISFVHKVGGMIVLVGAFGYYLWRRQQRYWLLALGVTVLPGMILNVVLKQVFQRSRPFFEEPLVTLSTYSFPSGHTAAATLFYGVLACYIMIACKGWSVRLATAAFCMLMIFLVAFSRVYLGAHYLSDVLAAMASSAAWLTICITAISTLRRRSEARSLAANGIM